MPDHRIRLRGAWDRVVLEGETEVVCRVSLPTVWAAGQLSPFRLLRRFGRPPFDPAAESVRLELLGVPGLVAVRLNGREIALPPGGGVDWSVPLGETLLARNALMLEVDLDSSDGPIREEGWGSIALVIGPKVERPG